jgi:predicted kinase
LGGIGFSPLSIILVWIRWFAILRVVKCRIKRLRVGVGMTLVSQRILSQFEPPHAPWREPVLVAVMGLPCTGKTELSTRLAARFPLVVLVTDQIRLAHNLPSGPAAHDVMRSVASVLLGRRRSVVFDGIHLSKTHRQSLRDFAEAHAARFELIYTLASTPVIEARLKARETSSAETSASGTFVISPEHFGRIRQDLEPPTTAEPAWTIETSDPDGLAGQLGPLEEHLHRLFVGEGD